MTHWCRNDLHYIKQSWWDRLNNWGKMGKPRVIYMQQLNNFKNFSTFDSALIRDNFTVRPIFILSETLEHVPKKPWKEHWKICCCQFANFASAHKKMLWFIHNLQNLIWRVQIPRMMFIFILEHFTGLSIQGNL